MEELISISPIIKEFSDGFSGAGSGMLFVLSTFIIVGYILTKHILPYAKEKSEKEMLSREKASDDITNIFKEQIKCIVDSASAEREAYLRSLEKFDTSIEKIVKEMEYSNECNREAFKTLEDKIEKVDKNVRKLDKELKVYKTDNGDNDE